MKKVYAYAHYYTRPQPKIVTSDNVSVGDCVEIHLPDGDTVKAVVESWNRQGIRCHQCCLNDWYMAHTIAGRLCPRNHRMFLSCGVMHIFKDMDKMMEDI